MHNWTFSASEVTTKQRCRNSIIIIMITDKSGIADNLIISILTAFLCLHSCEEHVDLPQIKHHKHCNSNSTPSAIFQGRAIWPWTPSHLEIFTGDSYSRVAYHEIQSDLFQKGSRVTIHKKMQMQTIMQKMYAEEVLMLLER